MVGMLTLLMLTLMSKMMGMLMLLNQRVSGIDMYMESYGEHDGPDSDPLAERAIGLYRNCFCASNRSTVFASKRRAGAESKLEQL